MNYVIDPVSDETNRPLISVMIPTCNRIEYLEKTIKSVLDQDLGPDLMQIEVIDNYSTIYDVKEYVKTIADERVAYYRQEKCVDFQENWTTCIRRAKGKWVHILHDDDFVLPDFYNTYICHINDNPSSELLFCQAQVVDKDEKPSYIIQPSNPNIFTKSKVEILQQLITDNFIPSTSAVVSRAIYEKIGGFNRTLMHTIDWDMWIRILLESQITYIDKPLLAYRIHPSSGSKVQDNHFELLDKKYQDILFIINYYSQYLPKNIQKDTIKKSLRNFSNGANNQAIISLHDNNKKTALYHSIWSYWLNPNPITFLRYLYIKLVSRIRFN